MQSQSCTCTLTDIYEFSELNLSTSDEHMFEQNEDKAAEEPMSEEEKERQMEEWKEELARVFFLFLPRLFTLYN